MASADRPADSEEEQSVGPGADKSAFVVALRRVAEEVAESADPDADCCLVAGPLRLVCWAVLDRNPAGTAA